MLFKLWCLGCVIYLKCSLTKLLVPKKVVVPRHAFGSADHPGNHFCQPYRYVFRNLAPE